MYIQDTMMRQCLIKKGRMSLFMGNPSFNHNHSVNLDPFGYKKKISFT